MTRIVNSLRRHWHTNDVCYIISKHTNKITLKKCGTSSCCAWSWTKTPSKMCEIKIQTHKTSKMCMFLKLPLLSFFSQIKKKGTNPTRGHMVKELRAPRGWTSTNRRSYQTPIITIPHIRIHVSHEKKPSYFPWVILVGEWRDPNSGLL